WPPLHQVTDLQYLRSVDVSILLPRNHTSADDYYRRFWQRAWDEAQDSLARASPTKSPEHTPCPKVYVYNLSEAFSDTNNSNRTSLSNAFGKVTIGGWNGRLRDTIQHHVGVIFEHRLLHQPDNCYVTDDPTEADLFFVPMLLRRKKASEWASACRDVNATALLDELTHLTPETECKHFFVFPKGHYSGEHCQGWFFDPLPRLRNAMRLAYSHTPGTADDSQLMYFTKAASNPEQAKLRHPNLVSIPYPSSLHWYGTENLHASTKPSLVENETMSSADPELQSGSNATIIASPSQQRTTKEEFEMPSSRHLPSHRPFLMSYVGRFDHGDVEVRRRIQQQCESYQDARKCHLPGSDIRRRSSLPSEDILVKGESIFCLEPAGDSPWRKGLTDSITFGCIPVLFSDLSDDITPWHWEDWKHRARVLIDRDDFLSGRIDLFELLSSIPSDMLRVMQTTLQKHAREYQYSLTDDKRDAFHLTLTKMKEEATKKVLSGQCGTKQIS
ncbi:MAG: hypothetical protein SGILL_010018, partial [Bacillariaceae sp.]